MKKFTCILLALILVISSGMISVSASDISETRFGDKFVDYLKNHGGGNLEFYEELFYHESDGETDWVLIHGKGTWTLCWCTLAVLGDRVFFSGNGDMPFEFDYGMNL